MWNNWEHKKGNAIKSEKYKDSAFIDIYKVDDHYEIICSVTDCIMFHTIFVNGEEMKISPAPAIYHNKAYLPLHIFEKAYGMEHIQNGNDIVVYKI